MDKCCVCLNWGMINYGGHYYCVDCLKNKWEKIDNKKEEKIEDTKIEVKYDNKEEIKEDVYCDCCGKLIKDVEDIFDVNCGQQRICMDCYHNHYAACSECGDLFHEDNYEIIDGRVFCAKCQSEFCSQCEDCNEWHITEDGFTTAYGDWICHDCFDDNYFFCDRCDEIYHVDQLHNCDGENYCDSCYADCYNPLHEYGYKPNVVFHEDNERNKHLHVGIELEIQGNGYDDFVNKMSESFNEDMFYMKQDGSLNDYGVEIVSQPMTYNFIMNHNDWYKVFRYMENHSMNDTDDCGLHFHLDKQYLNEKDISVIDYIVNNYADYFSEIGGRDFDECSHYCKKVNKSENDWGKETRYESRYQAVNLTNENTIELRFCKSTFDFDTFIQRVKMIFAIADFAKKHCIKDFYNMDNETFEIKFNKFMNDNFGYKED